MKSVIQFHSTKKIISNGVLKLLENDVYFKTFGDKAKANMRRKYSGVEGRLLQTYRRTFLYHVDSIHY
jgi:hypothetical protein